MATHTFKPVKLSEHLNSHGQFCGWRRFVNGQSFTLGDDRKLAEQKAQWIESYRDTRRDPKAPWSPTDLINIRETITTMKLRTAQDIADDEQWEQDEIGVERPGKRHEKRPAPKPTADAHIVLRPVIRKGQPQDEAPERATLTAAVRSFKPVEKLHLKWDFPFWQAVEPEAEEEEDELPSAETFAQTYAREAWESRTTIENRARTEGNLTVRDAKGLFEAANAEGHLDEKPDVEGKKRGKLYKVKNPVSTF